MSRARHAAAGATLERTLLPAILRQVVLIGLVVTVSLAGEARARTPYDRGCIDDHSFPHVELPNDLSFDAARARTLFRFHRQQEAATPLHSGAWVDHRDIAQRRGPEERCGAAASVIAAVSGAAGSLAG